MSILVTGANGQLGNEIRLIARGRDEKFVFSDVREVEGVDTLLLDITDPVQVEQAVSDHEVTAIINCAAYTDVDGAEDNPALCAKLNEEAPLILARAMNNVGGLLIHISTDYVFGGNSYNTPCTEDATGCPTGVYGTTKLAGERAVSGLGGSYVIIRTSWLYSEYGRNFLKTMLRLTAEKEQVSVVFDQVGTPTYALDLAEMIFCVVDDYKSELQKTESCPPYTKTGIYHYSNEGVCSWYDFAYAIAQLAGHTGCNVIPCHSSQYPSKVIRPPYSVLDKTKIKSVFGVTVPYWRDSLFRCMENIK
jgi:dTDP-4-dehydrorhamnose reductase